MVVDNKGIISYIRVLKEDLMIFRIKPSEGNVPDFKAGQFVTIGLHVPSEGKIVRRAYSIASPPEQKNVFELVVRWVKKPVPGRLTTELFNRRELDEVLWVKPTGAFTIDDKKHDGTPDNRRMVLIGGGTGLAPFISYALHLKATNSKREIVILHGASEGNDLARQTRSDECSALPKILSARMKAELFRGVERGIQGGSILVSVDGGSDRGFV